MRSLPPVGHLAVYGAAIVLTAAVLVSAFGFLGTESPGASSEPLSWERLPDPPLSPRSNVIAVWTGREALFVGGDTFICPPFASCTGDNVTVFNDGAAFDPAEQAWRSIADAPVPLPQASTAVVDDDVYFLLPGSRGREPAFLHYSIAADSWDSLPVPPAGMIAWYRLAALGGRVVAYAISHEGGASGDFVFAPGSGAWSELPESPLGPAFDREMASLGPHLYLFDHELVDNPGSERPSLTRAARLDLAAGTWERLPDSPILASGPWLSDHARLVNPLTGGADGGAVNNWGRPYPYGGIFDTSTRSWLELPKMPESGPPAGAIGPDGCLLLATSGWVLDVAASAWFELVDIPGDGDVTRRNLLSAGPDAIAFGGERWAGGSAQGELLGDAWIWRCDARR